MRALSILTALGLIIVAANTAQPETRQMAAMGIGTSTCAVFANMYQGDPQFAEQQFFNWTQGFLSGWNHSLMLTGQPFFDMGALAPRGNLHACARIVTGIHSEISWKPFGRSRKS